MYVPASAYKWGVLALCGENPLPQWAVREMKTHTMTCLTTALNGAENTHYPPPFPGSQAAGIICVSFLSTGEGKRGA